MMVTLGHSLVAVLGIAGTVVIASGAGLVVIELWKTIVKTARKEWR